MPPDQPLFTNEVDLVSALILTRNARLLSIRPAPESHTRLLSFELGHLSSHGRAIAADWQAHRFVGTEPGLKTSPSLSVAVACRLSPASRTIMHWVKNGGEFNNASKLVPEIVAALTGATLFVTPSPAVP